MSSYDVVIVGAGAAGIGAGIALREHGLTFVILEAADRVGGRAYTDFTSLPVPWDHGCHWLHCADVNPLVTWADRLGADYRKDEWEDHFTIWQPGGFCTAAELDDARGCTLAAFDALERARDLGHDVSIAEVLPDAGRWRTGVESVMRTMAGADPERVSAPGYLALEDTDINWPVLSGYGHLVTQMAANLPIRTGTGVEAIDQGATGVTLQTSAGTVTAKAAIVTVSTNVLTSGRIRFSGGPARDFADIVSDLPCGAYEKVALAVTNLPPDAAGRVFCMVDPGSGVPAIDFQILGTDPPVMIAHLAGETVLADFAGDDRAMIAEAVNRLTLAFGTGIRKTVIAGGASDWGHNPLIQGSYSHARPGAARQRAKAIRSETGNVAFAGEALSERWSGTAHGAYQSGRDIARKIAGRVTSD